MRPITLTMQAFGSYGRKTEIDFTKANRNLFLITGDTGAGKTTIFDAIVFALYGETGSTNNKKDGVELQSQYIAVEQTFSEMVGGETLRYTVKRSPRFVRPAKRKGGKKEIDVQEEVELTLPNGQVFSGKIGSVHADRHDCPGRIHGTAASFF